MDDTMNDENKSETTEQTSASGETLEQRLEAVKAERDDYLDKWTRSRADLENYRKRILKEMEEDRKYAPLPLLKSLLPALDGLDRALQSAKQTRNVDELLAGLEMVVKQFETSLQNVGVQSVQALGQPFDPHLHEAIQQQPTNDFPPMTVVNDVERGYVLHDRVVRPSKVIVSSEPKSE